MKATRKLCSLLLTLCLVTTFLPITSFAADKEPESKTVITSVDELMQFAKAVNNGDYDGKTDAVVSLEADLDMTGVDWVPIGSTLDETGNIAHSFSGKFYGNGHKISNFDFSSVYKKYDFGGFFGEIDNAEVSSLVIQGNIDVSEENEYVYFGAVAGAAGGCKITDCVSEVSFNNNGNFVYGVIGLCGYIEDTEITYCQNKGNVTITGDMGSLYVGGITGCALGNSEIKYCTNIGNMILAAPNGGEIAGYLSGTSKVINCYANGTLTPVGKGITNVGGIVGAVSGNAEINNCYFAGDIDLSQYTAVPPYTRFGSIAGNASGKSSFNNNYYAEKENVPACGRNDAAGSAKSLEYMRSEDFYREITEGGGDYRYLADNTPILPKIQYTVSFTVLPAELTNVVVKVNEQEVTSGTMNLEAGTYTVEGTADDCEPYRAEITISADTATHVQTLTLTYKPADYSKVDEAIAKVNALNKSEYKDFSAVEAAVNAVARDKNITEQAEVDKMAQAIEDAIAALEKCRWNMNFTTCENGDNCPLHKFADVDAKKWYHEGVHFCLDNGIMQGTDKGFEPQVITTRAMITTMLWRLDGEPKASYNMTFKDVQDGQWYTEAIRWAQSTGIVNGYDNNTFGTNDGMTREQVVTVMYRYAKYKGYDVSAAADLSKFADADSVSGWAADAVKWAVDTGIIVGDTRNDGRIIVLDPQGSSTRAQAATMLMRYCTTILK